MRAARYESVGTASDVLEVLEIPTPEPGPGEVRVRIMVAGVNPTDWKARATATGPLREGFQIPGQDGAGIVDAVGDGIDPSRVGERVWVWFAAWQRPWGTAAEYTVLPAEQAVPLPDGASFELGASLGIPALTAHRCLLADGPVEGRTVLVAGGAGAVGHAAIELARFLGARVISTVSSPDKGELAFSSGAHDVVNYHEEDAAARIRELAPEGVDRVVEVALGPNAELDAEVCAPHASVATYAADQPEASVTIRPLMVKNLNLRFVLVYTMPRPALLEAILGVTAALEAEALTTLPLHRFPLEDTAAAHDAVEDGAVGKVIIEVA